MSETLQVKTGPEQPITSYCTACWKDRILTTNGKCKTCGTDLVKRHWKTSIKKLEIVLSVKNVTPIEIKGKMYLIPEKALERFRSMESYPEKIKFIEYVKESCKNYKI